MTEINKKYDKKKKYMDFKRLSEKYVMLSTCLSRHNIEEILFSSISYDNNLLNACMTSLNNWLKNINAYKITNIEEYRQLLIDYNSAFFNYPTSYIDDFINFANSDLLNNIIELSYIASGTGRKAVPLNNANIGNRNLIFTFKSKVYLEHVHDEDEVPYCANAFWNFLMLILLTEYVNRFTQVDETISLNLNSFHNYINLNILTGLKMLAELETEVLYEELFEEISQFIPSNKHNIVKTVNEDKKAILFRIKNNRILKDAFNFYGWYKGLSNEFDLVLDRKSEAEFHIKHGSKPNTIQFTLFITGMRTISRVLSESCNPKGKIYLHNFCNKGGYYVGMIINLYLQAIKSNCNLKINKSYYTTYNEFIADYKGERNTALKSAIALLLSELPKNKQKRFIDKYFKKEDYRQKTAIYEDLTRVNKLKELDNICSYERFCKTLGKYYVW